MERQQPVQTEQTQALPVEGLIHLGVVYFVWGSTFLGIRVAVGPGGGFPPFTLVSSRLLLAGTLLLLWALVRGRRILPTRSELVVLAASGVLLWGLGNGLVVWAEQRVASGLAALMIGSIPLWTALLDSLVDRRLPERRAMIWLLVGFGGVTLLAAPLLQSGIRADLLSLLALFTSTITWALGVILQRRRPVEVGMVVSSAYQHLAGGIWMAAAAWIFHEPVPTPSTAAWLAWLYLVVFGGLAFTSYVQTLQLLPINLVMTHAYVNPAIAVFLGWVVLDEVLTAWTLSGMVLILIGVWGVFRRRGPAGH
ncbi:MAG: EamA family transporter [Anaerolineales bacterium]